ncbi:MAG: cytochrome b/b6 domain-containing protein [Pseudomonadota bacterium]
MAQPSPRADSTSRRLFVWELPVRLFHWTLVALVIALFVSIEVLDNMDRHAQLGYALLALVLFRLIWGVVGGTYARFRDFVHGPGKVLRYAKTFPDKAPEPIPGHNPLGGWMVVVLLLALLGQAVLGLFSNDDILFDGPLRGLVSKEASDTMTALHEQLFHVLLVLIGLHIAAVIYHKLRKGENLVSAMFTGYKRLPANTQAEPSRGGKSWLAAIILAACAGMVYWVVT